MTQSPCKDCPYRGCGARHDTCEPFLEWQKLNDQRRQANSTERVLDNMILKHRHTTFRLWAKKSRRDE